MSRFDETMLADQPDHVLGEEEDPEESNDSDASDVEFELGGEPEQDDTEEELEQLVFGDSAGFRRGLKALAKERDAEVEEDAQAITGLEGLEDADVGRAHDCM